jgi:hypothetical protein
MVPIACFGGALSDTLFGGEEDDQLFGYADTPVKSITGGIRQGVEPDDEVSDILLSVSCENISHSRFARADRLDSRRNRLKFSPADQPRCGVNRARSAFYASGSKRASSFG